MILFVVFLNAADAFAQTKEITRDEFYEPQRAVYNFDGTFRITSKEDFYRNGKITGSVVIIDENIKSERRHFSYFEKFGTKTEKLEAIQIGETYFCKYDAEKWKKTEDFCGDNMTEDLPDLISDKYTVENVNYENRDAQLYEHYEISRREKGKIYYKREKFWLTGGGLVLRGEDESGEVASKIIFSKTIELYEYNPKDLKIEAPIKP